jgi:hypothetical protein
MVIKNKNAGVSMSQTCPCDIGCKQQRKIAVNLIIEKGVCTAKDLQVLIGDRLGSHALRRSMEFLSSGNCKLVNVYTISDKKSPQFGRKGRLYYSRSLPPAFLKSTIIGLLSRLQNRILDKFLSLNRQIYYFSMYDIRRIVPSSGTEIDYALERLVKLSLLIKVPYSGVDFFMTPNNRLKFENEKQQAIIDNKTEYAMVKSVHELIMHLYPPGLVTGYQDRIRPHTQDVLTITGGMSFDLFYQFFDPVAGKSYLAVDVYTRFPVTGFMIHSFAKKIEWAKAINRRTKTNYLKDKTCGIIVFRNATQKAFPIANRLGIRFLRLGDDLKIDYDGKHKELESALVSVLN